jgi:hypothetical protein
MQTAAASSHLDPEAPPQYQESSQQQGNYPQNQNPYPYMLPLGLDPNNVEAMTAYRNAFYKKRAYLMIFMGIMSFFMLMVPFGFLISSGTRATSLIPFIIPLICVVGFPAYGWISYKKVIATPYIPGTHLFLTGRFGRMMMKY